jgi:glycosyltransferase involved in cell wall biosynthesis
MHAAMDATTIEAVATSSANAIATCDPGRAPQRRPRVALISPWRPEPVDNGSKQRIKGIIDALAPMCDLALISLLPEDEFARSRPGSMPGISREWILPMPAFRERSAPALLAGLARMPRSFSATWDPVIARQVATYAVEFGADVLLGTDLRVIRYLCCRDLYVPRLLDEANVSPVIADAYATGLATGNLRARLRARKYRHLLGTVSSRLNAVVVSSVHEAAAFEALTDRPAVTVIENSVTELPAAPWNPTASSRLLYTGSLSYAANADAIAYFQRAIYPLVLGQEPAAQLVITGGIPDPLPPGVNTRRLTLTGRLASLDATRRDARMLIVPLRCGTGTRIKILEALAYGMPVVTTSKGAEGLAVEHGQHLLIADEPDDFARAIVQLMRDDGFAMELGARGRTLIEARYTWDRQGARLRALVRDLLDDRV